MLPLHAIEFVGFLKENLLIDGHSIAQNIM